MTFTTIQKAGPFIADRAPFHISTRAFRGGRPARKPLTGRVPHGLLPASLRGGLQDADYVVWSYDTPIAWHTSDAVFFGTGWVVPDVAFGPTTTRHQAQVRFALRVRDIPLRRLVDPEYADARAGEFDGAARRVS